MATIEDVIQRKMAAAQQLGLRTVESFKKVEGAYFHMIEFKKEDTVVDKLAVPVERDQVLKDLNTIKRQFEQKAKDVDAKIKELEALR